MKAASILLLAISILCIHGPTAVKTTSQGGTLFLTALIKKNETCDALYESNVKMFVDEYGVREAHSGFITVDNENSRHFFFLYVGAQNDNANKAPLVLWLRGGPGRSALFGQFLETGPVSIDGNGNLTTRKATLQRDANLIYLDQPAGSGYSFSNGTGSPNLTERTEDIEEFMRQFLLLFPKFNGRDFYIAGESFGARIAILLANRHHNLGQDRVNLALCGVICGASFLAPILYQLNVSNFLYEQHLLNDSGRQIFVERFNKLTSLQYTGEQDAAVDLLLNTTFASWNYSDHNLFTELTNHTYDGNVAQKHEPAAFRKYREFINSTKFRQEIHVGQDSKFYDNSAAIFKEIYAEYLMDTNTIIQQLLESYRVLAYTGSMDALISPNATKEFFSSLRWRRTSYQATFQNADFERYSIKGNLVHTVVRGAGHYPAFDRPHVIYGLIARFIEKAYWNY